MLMRATLSKCRALLATAVLVCPCFHSALACTDFRITADDGTVLITRTLEFVQDLKSNLRSSPRERSFAMTAPNGKPGMTWKSKFGYVYLDGLDQDFAMDGLNEQGLSFEYLYLPNETQYQTIPEGQENRSLGYLNFGDWILGNFKTVDEVKAALPNILVYSQTLAAANNIVFPLHAAIYDANGKGIVVEFVNGKLNVFDNKIGVMTNSPTYDWQITNLRNYVNLSPITPKPVFAEGIEFVATGQGSGMKGLPGDISPPSRFVKMALMLETVLASKDITSALNNAQHIINNVDIPLGFVREPQTGKIVNEYTQWALFKDLTHKTFYYRTYDDTSLRMVTLADVDFSAKAPLLKMPLARSQTLSDVTDLFIKTIPPETADNGRGGKNR